MWQFPNAKPVVWCQFRRISSSIYANKNKDNALSSHEARHIQLQKYINTDWKLYSVYSEVIIVDFLEMSWLRPMKVCKIALESSSLWNKRFGGEGGNTKIEYNRRGMWLGGRTRRGSNPSSFSYHLGDCVNGLIALILIGPWNFIPSSFNQASGRAHLFSKVVAAALVGGWRQQRPRVVSSCAFLNYCGQTKANIFIAGPM